MSIENTITNIQGINACRCPYETDSQFGWRSFVLLICSAFCCFSLTKTWNRKDNKRTMDPGPEYDGVLLALNASLYTVSNINGYGWVWFEELSRSVRVLSASGERVTVQDMLNSPFHIISYVISYQKLNQWIMHNSSTVPLSFWYLEVSGYEGLFILADILLKAIFIR